MREIDPATLKAAAERLEEIRKSPWSEIVKGERDTVDSDLRDEKRPIDNRVVEHAGLVPKTDPWSQVIKIGRDGKSVLMSADSPEADDKVPSPSEVFRGEEEAVLCFLDYTGQVFGRRYPEVLHAALDAQRSRMTQIHRSANGLRRMAEATREGEQKIVAQISKVRVDPVL